MLTKSPRYYYDYAAIEEPIHPDTLSRSRSAANIHSLYDHRSGKEQNYFRQKNEWGAGTGIKGLTHISAVIADKTSRRKKSVWTVTVGHRRGYHEATFPDDLVKPCILAGCPRDGVVLDPFGGSGTTGLVAKQLGRRPILIELNSDHARMAKDRLGASGGRSGNHPPLHTFP